MWYTMEGPLFCTVLLVRKSKKKGHSRIPEEKMTKISDYVFVISIIFQQERERLPYYCLYFQIFYVFDKQNPADLDFFRYSVCYN